MGDLTAKEKKIGAEIYARFEQIKGSVNEIDFLALIQLYFSEITITAIKRRAVQTLKTIKTQN